MILQMSLNVFKDNEYDISVIERREMEQMVKSRMASLGLPLMEYSKLTT